MTHPTDTAKSEELKPADCPFCCSALSGPHFSDAEVKYWIHPGVITDGECFFSGQGIYAPQLAAWNRRSSPPQNDAGGEGLREAVERFIADYDDGDRADAGTNPLMEAHIADLRAALRTPMSELQALGQEFEAGAPNLDSYIAGREDEAEMRGWRPIETAPKDGTEILLGAPAQTFRGQPIAPRSTIGHWMTEEECRERIGDCGGECRCPEYKFHDPFWLSWDGGFTEENPPTHWMPLPSAPSGEG